jgi:L-ascorbate metabolism protein UlaG (beta-lactamase superfamily)
LSIRYALTTPMGQYVYNSSLPFVRPNFNGNRISGERFTNYPYPDPHPGLKQILKWKLSANPARKEKKKDPFKLDVQFLPRLPEQPENCLIWLGHASFYIRMGGVSLLIDPVLGRLPLVRRMAPSPIAVEELLNLDYILISHAHRDHYDRKTLNQILKNNPGAEILGPLRIHQLLAKLKVMPAHQEAGWYQQYDLRKPLKIVFLPAVHWYRRGLFDLNKILWGSFYISDGVRRIFFAGDTAYNKHFKSIAELMGPIDISLLPIGAYRPEHIMQASHLNPAEAVKAAGQLQSSITIPMHYGTLDLTDEPPGEPLRWLQQLEEEKAITNSLKIIQPGEVIPL